MYMAALFFYIHVTSICTDQGQVIRTKMSGISMLGRVAQGVRIIRLKDGEKVVAVEGIAEEDSDDIEE